MMFSSKIFNVFQSIVVTEEAKFKTIGIIPTNHSVCGKDKNVISTIFYQKKSQHCNHSVSRNAPERRENSINLLYESRSMRKVGNADAEFYLSL